MSAQVTEGLQCTGGGEPCNTGMMGVCAAGLTRCGAMGCQQRTTPSSETCDGQDNDCDGMTDEGGALCAGGNVCDRGRCVPPCLEGACFDSQRCINGLCVEATCVNVMCPEGQRCIDGACRGACDAVVCPADRVCRAGACVDPCTGARCPSGQMCANGECVAAIPVRPEPSTEPSIEAGVIDSGAVTDAGMDGSSRGDAGSFDSGAGGRDAGAAPSPVGGCGCRAPQPTSRSNISWLALAAGASLALRANRRRRSNTV